MRRLVDGARALERLVLPTTALRTWREIASEHCVHEAELRPGSILQLRPGALPGLAAVG